MLFIARSPHTTLSFVLRPEPIKGFSPLAALFFSLCEISRSETDSYESSSLLKNSIGVGRCHSVPPPPGHVLPAGSFAAPATLYLLHDERNESSLGPVVEMLLGPAKKTLVQRPVGRERSLFLILLQESVCAAFLNEGRLPPFDGYRVLAVAKNLALN